MYKPTPLEQHRVATVKPVEWWRGRTPSLIRHCLLGAGYKCSSSARGMYGRSVL